MRDGEVALPVDRLIVRSGEPLADQQRWYDWVNHKYCAKWGQIVEFRTVGGRLSYARAECPDGTLQDLRALSIEQKLGSSIGEAQFAAAKTVADLVRVQPGAPLASV